MNLKQFCGIDDIRYYLNYPSNVGDRTIATNGHIMVTVPRDDQYKDAEGQAAKSFSLVVGGFEGRVYVKAKKFKLGKPEACETCEETGHSVTNACECCGAEYHSVDTEEVCRNCLGTGKIYSSEGVEQYFGFYAPRYLNLIQSFPKLEISPDEENKKLYFRSGDIEGVLMGVKA